MSKRVYAIVVLLLSLMLLTACGSGSTANREDAEPANGEPAADRKIKVYTTLFVTTDFAQSIAGDKASVENIVPAGVEPHDFEPTAKDMIKLNEADLFVYNGAGFEGWVEKALQAIESKEIVVVDASKDIELIRSEDGAHEGHGPDEHAGEEDQGHDEHADEENHDNGEFDPHIWLDPLKAKKQAELIKEALVQADPANETYYEDNFQALSHQVDELDSSYRDLVVNAKHKEIVVSHAAFGYLAHAYGLEQIAISGISPSNEPSQKQLKDIIETVKAHEIEYILFDSLVSGKVAEVVKQEAGAEALTLHTLENLTQEELAQGKNYFSVMKDNLEVLKKALKASEK
ncbi:metal ABC transporter substrate-binding protein [Ammoniphilus sp. 3BR4]|uniref:metal ABC transporter substrate-binding protein n=1 Tax=Ammoniphilus sp. 3BR4 TaxID=3158265 RepID=UPI003467B99F